MLKAAAYLLVSLIVVGNLFYTDSILYDSDISCLRWNPERSRFDNMYPTFFGLTLIIHSMLVVICVAFFVDNLSEQAIPQCTIFAGYIGALLVFCCGIIMVTQIALMENVKSCLMHKSVLWFLVWNIPGVIIVGGLLLAKLC